MDNKIDISLVIPCLDEAASLPELVLYIENSLRPSGLRYEIIFIDDGSRDNTWQVIQELKKTALSPLYAYRFQRNYGKSAALQVGFRHTHGNVVITLDADLQDSPEEILPLYKMIIEEKYDLVTGWKKTRYDPWSKRFPSKIFNFVVSRISKLKLHDFNCGIKAYTGQLARTINLYGDMHRYIPVIAKWNGFDKITEKIVEHKPRKYGHSKYGFSRIITGFLDLLSITFIYKYKKNPMHFFGTLGVIIFLLGLCATSFLIFEKLYANIVLNTQIRLVTDRWYFYLALVCLILGVQLFSMGFLGEMLATQQKTNTMGYIISDCIENSVDGSIEDSVSQGEIKKNNNFIA